MISWLWLIPTLIAGILIGVGVIAICSANDPVVSDEELDNNEYSSRSNKSS